MIERLFKMLGNISKKKGNNGDFYTKAVVDKKIKDTETAVRAYTDKAAADAKNDILTDVGEKVDKVSGKSLINKAFADDVSTRKAALGNGNIATIDSQLETYSITTRLEAEVAISGMDDSGNTVIKHKLSEKANTSDLVNKVDKVNGKSLVDATDIRTAVQNGDLTFADMKGITLRKTLSQETEDSGKIETSIIANGEEITASLDVSENPTARHTASFWYGGIEAESGLKDNPNGVSRLTASDITVSTPINGKNVNLTANDVTIRQNVTAIHKLSEKANAVDLTELKENTTNIYNSCGGFAAGEGAEVYGTPELGSGEIGLIGDIPLNAIQLGSGTNDKVFTMKVYDYELIVDGASKGSKSATDGKKYIKDVGALSDLTTTDKSSIVAAINEVKSSGGGDVLDNLTYDSTNDIINSSANLLLANSASVAAYNGTFRGDIKVGQLGANKWAYTISPITGFSTSVDVTCTSGNVVHNLSAKADTTNVLTRNNTQTFTPTGDYQPATKKYVDDLIAALRADLGLE